MNSKQAIVSYGVIEGSQISFPLTSNDEINISENSFKALKSIFDLLDKVFRGAGNQCIPQKHSTVAAHKLGLVKLGKKEVFDQLRELHGSNPEFSKTEKEFNLMALTHDAPEVIGEISTFANRLSKDIGGISEDDREQLEKKVAYIIFYLALKATKEKDPRILEKPILKLQKTLPLQKDQYERYKYAQTEFVEKLYQLALDGVTNNQDLESDHSVLVTTFFKMEKDSSENNPSVENFSGILTKLLDKLESIYYVSHDQVGDYSDPEKNKVQQGAFNTPEKLFHKLNSITTNSRFYDDVKLRVKDFYNSCIKQFKSRSNSFQDFQEI